MSNRNQAPAEVSPGIVVGMEGLPQALHGAFEAAVQLTDVVEAAKAEIGEDNRFIVRPPAGMVLTASLQRIGGGHGLVWEQEEITAENGFEATSISVPRIDLKYVKDLRRHELRKDWPGYKGAPAPEIVTFWRSGPQRRRLPSIWKLNVPANIAKDLTIEPLESAPDPTEKLGSDAVAAATSHPQ